MHEGSMSFSFQSPWLLLGLILLPAAVGVWMLAERRRMRYAVQYTNVDVLASVVSGRSGTACAACDLPLGSPRCW
jgi:hypothetical protein